MCEFNFPFQAKFRKQKMAAAATAVPNAKAINALHKKTLASLVVNGLGGGGGASSSSSSSSPARASPVKPGNKRVVCIPNPPHGDLVIDGSGDYNPETKTGSYPDFTLLAHIKLLHGSNALTSFRKTKNVCMSTLLELTDRKNNWSAGAPSIYLCNYLPAMTILGTNALIVESVRYESEEEYRERVERYGGDPAEWANKRKLFVSFLGVRERLAQAGIPEEDLKDAKLEYTVPPYWYKPLAQLIKRATPFTLHDPIVFVIIAREVTQRVEEEVYEESTDQAVPPKMKKKIFVNAKSTLAAGSLGDVPASLLKELLPNFMMKQYAAAACGGDTTTPENSGSKRKAAASSSSTPPSAPKTKRVKKNSPPLAPNKTIPPPPQHYMDEEAEGIEEISEEEYGEMNDFLEQLKQDVEANEL